MAKNHPPARAEGSLASAVTQALVGELPSDWRERRGLAPAEPAPAPPQPPRPTPALPGKMRQLGWADWRAILRETYAEFGNDRVLSVAGGVTFFSLLALFPAITTLVSIYGLFAAPENIAAHLNLLNHVLPGDVVAIIRDQIIHIAATPVATLTTTGIASLLIAVYSATGGMKALIESLNLAWSEQETRGILRLNLIGLGFTAGAIVLVLAMLAAIAVVPLVMEWLHVPAELRRMVNFTRWPGMFLVLTLAIAALYRWAPDRTGDDPAFRVMPGAVLAALALVAASAGFSWYVTNLAHYNQTYGSLGAVIVLMMWLWIASIIIMLGVELNAAIARQLSKIS